MHQFTFFESYHMISRCELLFCAIVFITWEQNLSLNAKVFSCPMFANCVHVFNRCAFTFGNFFFENPKCSSGHVENSFDNPVAKFLPKIQKKFRSKSEKNLETSFFHKIRFSFLKMFLWITAKLP